MIGASQPWVLGTFNFQTVTVTEGAFSDTTRIETTFDTTTGFLECRRSLEGTSRGTDDVLVVFTDLDGDGNVDREAYYVSGLKTDYLYDVMARLTTVLPQHFHLALLREATDGEPPTLTLPSRLRFASTEALDAFTVELTEQLGRLVRKYHDEYAEACYWFVLSAYPEVSEAS